MQSRDYLLSVRRSTLFLKQNVETKEVNTFHVHQTNIQTFHAFLVLIGCLYFPTPGHGPSPWPYFLALPPPICIYQPWFPICIYQPWFPICIYWCWPQFVFTSACPQFVFTSTGLQIALLFSTKLVKKIILH